MSSIDERIVQMQFDNAQFEKGVSTTLGSLDKLKQGLNFEGSEKGLTALGNAINSVSFSGLSSGIEEVNAHFSAMEAFAFGVIQNIASRVTDLGIHFAKSLTVDQLTAGFSKLEAETRNVSTIVNQTGRDITEVEGFVDELNWYADVTSYSTESMTSALSQFTSQGIELETAIPAIMGIGNSMTYAGASAQQAANGFQIYARAMAKGSMALHEWRQLQTLRVATAGLKQEFIDAAVAIGNLKEGEVTIASFEDSLQHGDTQGWLTTSVMLDVLSKKYGTFTNDIYGFTRAQEDETGEVLTLNQALEKYNGTADAFGQKVLESATLARTFQDAIDAAKDASSSAWKDIFKAVIGNADEATEIWTGLNDVLVETFSQPLTDIALIMTKWKELGGRDSFLAGIKNLFIAIKNVVNDASAALDRFFPKLDANRLVSFTTKFKITAENLRKATESIAYIDIGKGNEDSLSKLLDRRKKVYDSKAKEIADAADTVSDSEEKALVRRQERLQTKAESYEIDIVPDHFEGYEKLKKVFEGVSASLDIIKMAIDGVKAGFKEMAPGIEYAKEQLSQFVLKVSDTIVKARDYLKEHQYIQEAFKLLGRAINNILLLPTKMGGLFSWIQKILSFTVEKIKEFISSFSDKDFQFFETLRLVIEKLANGIKGLWDILSKFAFKTAEIAGKIATSLSKAFSSADLANFIKIVNGGILTAILSKLNKFAGGLKGVGEEIKEGGLSGVFKTLDAAFKEGGAKSGFSAILDGLTNSLNGVIDFLKQFGELKVKAEFIRSIAVSLVILAAAMMIISSIDGEDLVNATLWMTAAFAEIGFAIEKLNKVKIDKGISTSIIVLAASVLILASAAKKMASLDVGELVQGLIAIGVLMEAVKLFIENIKVGDSFGAAAVSMIPLALGLLILSAAVKAYGSMDLGVLAQGFISLGLGLAAIFLAVRSAPDNIIAASAGMLILAVALTALLVPIFVLSKMDWQNVAMAIAEIAGALLLIGGALNVFPVTTPIIAAGLVILAAAIALLSVSLIALSLVPWENMLTSIALLVVTLAALAGAAILMQAVAVPMLIFAGVLTAVGISMAVFGAGLLAVSVGLQALVSLIVNIVKDILSLLETLVKGIGAVVKGIFGLFSKKNGEEAGGGFISGLLGAFKKGKKGAKDGSEELGDAVAEGLNDSQDKVEKSSSGIVSKFLTAITGKKSEAKTKAKELGSSGAEGLASASDEWNIASLNLTDSSIAGISDSIPGFEDISKQFGISGLDAFGSTEMDWTKMGELLGSDSISGLDSMQTLMQQSGLNLSKAGVTGIKSNDSEWKSAGRNTIAGYIEGLKEKAKSVDATARKIAQQALKATKYELDIESPSKKFMEIGKFSDLGFAKGLDRFSYAVNNSAEDVGKSALYALEAPMNMLSSAIQDDWDDTLTITPVLNLSEIQNGMSYMNAMMSSSMITPSFNGFAQAASMQQTADLMARLNNLETTMVGLLTATQAAASLNTAAAIRDALAGTGIYMDSRKVGELVSSQQAYMKRTRGL